MNILFDDGGKILAARLLSETDGALQVELPSGKRQKIKSAALLLRFSSPAAADMLAQAHEQAQQVDLDLAWEFAPSDEFGFGQIADDYFGAGASALQQAATLLALFGAPHYFRRAGKGRFRKASAEVLQQALAAIAKKAQLQAEIDAWAKQLQSGACPPAVAQQLYKILFKPDKNAPQYKAVVQASKQAQLPPLRLLQRAGAISSAYQFHWQRFVFDQFPQGVDWSTLPPLPQLDLEALPLASAHAYSIDDAATTEIDDALSVQGLDGGGVRLGVHIAVPALGIRPGDAFDEVARSRMSTVYMPGHKLTMLPEALVQRFTLQAGGHCPALSLYLDIAPDGSVLASRSALERVWVADNLRHDHLEDELDQAFFDQPDAPADPRDWVRQLRWLYGFARARKAQREAVRGKPESFNRPDFNFALLDVVGDAPSGDERVRITQRRRGSPLDLIVAECMIVANQVWGQWLADLGVPAIYRSQASMAPGVKVRMSTKALPHAGMGVPCYAWSTSPLRRYADLVNQWQLLACVAHGKTAALAAPFKAKDTALLAIISGFESSYAAYNEFQRGMERYWTLRYLQQNAITELDAQVLNDRLVRAEGLPLVLASVGVQACARGARVRVRLGEIDLIALEVSAQLIAQLDASAQDAQTWDQGDEGEEVDESTGVKLALSVNDNDATDHVQ